MIGETSLTGFGLQRLSDYVVERDTKFSRYMLATGFVGLALILTLLLQHVEQDRPTLFLFFAAIVASAWFGGTGPGCFAVVASIPPALYFYFAALHTFAITVDNVVLFIFFGSCAVAGGVLSSRQREAEEVLQSTHRQLELKARELQNANSVLLNEIGERKRTELALREAQTELATVARLTTMGELAASIAHEINQPLAAIVMNAGACMRWLEPARFDLVEARDAAQRIIRDGNRASEVIGRIRAMVRNALPERAPFEVNALVIDCIALLRNELAKHLVNVSLDLAEGLAPVRGDRILLHQVVLNLITNAQEAMALVHDRPRLLCVRTTRRRCGTLALAVIDNGPGIIAESHDRIFDAFVTTKAHGMGLGLSICRSIVEAHGGTLSAVPSLPYGTVFEVTLSETGE